MKGDAVPDPDHASRHCKPSTVQDGMVSLNAFFFCDHLSVNWLEYLRAPGLESAIDAVRETFGQKCFDAGAIRRAQCGQYQGCRT